MYAATVIKMTSETGHGMEMVILFNNSDLWDRKHNSTTEEMEGRRNGNGGNSMETSIRTNKNYVRSFLHHFGLLNGIRWEFVCFFFKSKDSLSGHFSCFFWVF